MCAPVQHRIEVRLAEPDDIAAFGPIDASTEQQFVDAGHPEFLGGGTIADDEARRAIDEGRLLVATTGGRVVGWAYTTRCGPELCVGQISVHADQQRRGIGKQLMQRIIADAEAAGEASLVLNTQTDVAWNRPWYESIGFRVVSPEDWTDGMRALVAEQSADGLDWTTRVHMRRDLRR
jgi:GNAT superfamily N-acetyltransferase